VVADISAHVDTVRPSAVFDASGLSYSVYTFADLEATGQLRPPRMSVAYAPPPSVAPSRWRGVGKTGDALVRSCWAWVRTPNPRPPVIDVCRAPLQAFARELTIALRALPWKKFAMWTGVVVGILAVLLFAVLMIAELTDDLKPARPRAAMTSLSGPSTTATFAMDPTTAVLDAPKAVERAPIERAGPTVDTLSSQRYEFSMSPPKKVAPKKKAVELFIP
jgi:hypothetical protein